MHLRATHPAGVLPVLQVSEDRLRIQQSNCSSPLNAHFRDRGGSPAILVTTNTVKLGPTMESLERVGPEWRVRWMKQWRFSKLQGDARERTYGEKTARRVTDERLNYLTLRMATE